MGRQVLVSQVAWVYWRVDQHCCDRCGAAFSPAQCRLHAFSALTIGRGRNVIAMEPSFAISKRARLSTFFPTGSQRRWLHGCESIRERRSSVATGPALTQMQHGELLQKPFRSPIAGIG